MSSVDLHDMGARMGVRVLGRMAAGVLLAMTMTPLPAQQTQDAQVDSTLADILPAPATAPGPWAAGIAVPGAPGVDIDALWARSLAQPPATIAGAIAALDPLYGDGGEFLADRCVSARPKLDEALAAVPVSWSLWQDSSRCAEAEGDEARAERDLLAFEALVRHGFDAVGGKPSPMAPIRVIHWLDAYAFHEATGRTLMVGYFDPDRTSRFRLLRLVLRDDETEQEQDIYFDIIESLLASSEADPETRAYARTPLMRMRLSDELIQSLAEAGAESAVYTHAVHQAFAKGADLPAVVSALERAALDSNFLAAMAMHRLCRTRDIDCADRSVDALLPFAEIGVTDAMVLLAISNLAGRGVIMDRAAAVQLAARADRARGEAWGSRMLLEAAHADGLRERVPTAVIDAIRASADAGDIDSKLALEIDRAQTDVEAIDAAWYGRVADLVPQGSGSGFEWLAAHLDSVTDHEGEVVPPAGAVALMRALARRGSPKAQLLLAKQIDVGRVQAEPGESASAWYREAGSGGEASGSYAAAWFFEKENRRADALYWYLSAGFQNNPSGVANAARLAFSGVESFLTVERAEHMLRLQLEESDHALTRKVLAEHLIEAHGYARDEEIRDLLDPLADRRDVDAMKALGHYLIGLPPDKRTVREGQRLLQRAADRESDAAALYLAMAIYSGQARGTPKAALGLLEQAAKSEFWGPANNLAWLSCVSSDARYVDPARGQRVLAGLPAANAEIPNVVSTRAACHAANGEFEQAAELMRGLIARSKAEPDLDIDTRHLDERLARYEAGEIWREDPSVARIVTRLAPEPAAATKPEAATERSDKDASPSGAAESDDSAEGERQR